MKSLSPDHQRLVRIALRLAATPGHLDANCSGSGTKHCSRAQIVSVARPSKTQPYFDGSFLLEGQPAKRDANGKRVVDPSKTTEGVGSSFELLEQWEAGSRFLPTFTAGRVSGTPGNDTHFVIGVGQDGQRVRDVQYQTASFGGLARRLANMNPEAFEPIETLVQKAASLTIAQETWLTFAPPFDADENFARIIAYLFGEFLVERQHEEPDLWAAGRLQCLRPQTSGAPGPSQHKEATARMEGDAHGEDDGEAEDGGDDEDDGDEDELGEANDDELDGEKHDGGALVTKAKATDQDLQCLAELQATAKYMETLRLFLFAQPTTALVVNHRDILQHSYYFWSSRADALYTTYTSKLQGLWNGAVAPVAIVTAFAAIHHLPHVKKEVFDNIDWTNRKFRETAMGRALEQLDRDVQPWFNLLTPLTTGSPPKIEQRKERFELRVTQEGHKPEEHLAKLLAFAHRARTAITEKTKSYAELYDCLVGQVPKGVKPFGPLRAVLIVREIGHALKGVVRDGTGLEVDTMPSANEHRVAMNLTLRDGQRATLQSHLGRVDAHLASLHKSPAAAAMLPAHVYEKVAELHDAAAVVVDKEPVSCETMRELRDLHAVLIQKKKISSNCLGRQIIVHGTGPGANKELDYVYRGARKTMSLSLSATEVRQVRGALAAVYKDLVGQLTRATELVHAMLRRDQRRAKRKRAAEKRKAKNARR